MIVICEQIIWFTKGPDSNVIWDENNLLNNRVFIFKKKKKSDINAYLQ